MAALREAKKQGVVRFIGASGHVHPTRFHEALDSGEIDVLMNAVNFVVQHTYDFEHKVWSRAQKPERRPGGDEGARRRGAAREAASRSTRSTTSRPSATPSRSRASPSP